MKETAYEDSKVGGKTYRRHLSRLATVGLVIGAALLLWFTQGLLMRGLDALLDVFGW